MRFRLITVLTCCMFCMQAYAAGDTEALLSSFSTSISGISISGAENEILLLLGKPNSIESGKFSPLNYGPYKILYYDGYSAFFVRDMLYGFNCSAQNCKTNMNIRVGDELSDVISVYGAGHRSTNDSGDILLSYALKDSNSSLIFLFNWEKVSHIRLIRHLR